MTLHTHSMPTAATAELRRERRCDSESDSRTPRAAALTVCARPLPVPLRPSRRHFGDGARPSPAEAQLDKSGGGAEDAADDDEHDLVLCPHERSNETHVSSGGSARAKVRTLNRHTHP